MQRIDEVLKINSLNLPQLGPIIQYDFKLGLKSKIYFSFVSEHAMSARSSGLPALVALTIATLLPSTVTPGKFEKKPIDLLIE